MLFYDSLPQSLTQSPTHSLTHSLTQPAPHILLTPPTHFIHHQHRCFQAASEYWQSQAVKEDAAARGSGYAEEITRLQRAEAYLRQALEIAEKARLGKKNDDLRVTELICPYIESDPFPNPIMKLTNQHDTNILPTMIYYDLKLCPSIDNV